MMSREHKRSSSSSSSSSVLHEKLQLLRSITHSRALKKTSIVLDASKYIEKLKQEVETLNRDIEEFPESSFVQPSLPMVTVENLEKGFLINVFSNKSCPGLLVCLLEAFEELGLNVLEARASCTDSFRLQAVGEKGDQGEIIGSQVIKRAVVEAIHKWSQGNDSN